jgi:hypothetical protein
VLTTLRFACLSGGQRTAESLAAGRDLQKEIAGLQKLNWSFSGTKHFIEESPAFTGKAAQWVRLLEALEQSDKSKAFTALTALGVPR